MTEATCARCAGPMQPAAGTRTRIYCSQQCRQIAKDARKTERYQQDLQYRARVLEQRRTLHHARGGRPQQTGTSETCPVCAVEFDGMLGKVYCGERCRRRAAAARYAGGTTDVVLASLASRFGAYHPKHKPVRCRVGVGVLVHCPNCAAVMGATSPTHRACHGCGTTLQLNAEEVSWVTFERRSTAALAAASA